MSRSGEVHLSAITMGSLDVNAGPADASSGRYLNWNDEALFVSEDHRRRLYRRLQSRYRQERLDAPYGWTKPRAATTQRPAVLARPVGSLLDPKWGSEHPAANFLAPSECAELILAYVNTRENDVLKSGGSLDPVRLRTNMLSSMPRCFNLFAPLRAQPAAALDLLRRGFGVDAVELIQIADIDGIECEWAPPPSAGIGDRTAFDAVVSYRDGLGQRCILGVETKYTETFSTTEYGRPGDERQASRRAHYRRWTQAGWFREGRRIGCTPAQRISFGATSCSQRRARRCRTLTEPTLPLSGFRGTRMR